MNADRDTEGGFLNEFSVITGDCVFYAEVGVFLFNNFSTLFVVALSLPLSLSHFHYLAQLFHSWAQREPLRSGSFSNMHCFFCLSYYLFSFPKTHTHSPSLSLFAFSSAQTRHGDREDEIRGWEGKLKRFEECADEEWRKQIVFR